MDGDGYTLLWHQAGLRARDEDSIQKLFAFLIGKHVYSMVANLVRHGTYDTTV